MREIAKKEKLGATGREPDGKIDGTDAGEVLVAVGHENGLVYINYGTEVTWVAMPPDQAIEMANVLRTNAMKAYMEANG